MTTLELKYLPLHLSRVDELDLTDTEVAHLLWYLRNGNVILSSRLSRPDMVSHSTADNIGIWYATDGTWVWSSEAPAYVERYRLGLPDEFIRHALRSTDGVGPITEDTRRDALLFVLPGIDGVGAHAST